MNCKTNKTFNCSWRNSNCKSKIYLRN